MVNNKNNNKKGNGQAKRKPRAGDTKPVKTGGGRRSNKPSRGSDQAQHLIKHGLNAFSQVHLPLPVSTGKYHTIRTLKTIAVADYLTLLGPCRTENGDWRTYTAFGFPASGTLLNAATVRAHTSENPFPGATGNDVECVPSAFSVQVTCNSSLFNAAGVTYVGRMKTGYTAPAATDARAASALADALQSYTPLRMIPNAELVTSPKQVNAIPTNFTELAEFTPIVDDADSAGINWSAGNYGFAGFAPIVIYNPTLANLQINVCTEWRVRLDPFNPMHASGKLHPPASPSVWHAITAAAENAGHGVEEIAGAAAGAYAVSQAGGFGAIMETIGTYAARALPMLEAAAPLLLV